MKCKSEKNFDNFLYHNFFSGILVCLQNYATFKLIDFQNYILLQIKIFKLEKLILKNN